MNKHGCLCSSTLILLHNHPFIYGRGEEGFLCKLSTADAGTQKRAVNSRWCEVESGARRYLRSWRPGFPRIWRTGASGDGHIHTRNVLQVLARGLVREVSSLPLCCTGLGSTPSPLSAAPSVGGPRRRGPLLSSGARGRRSRRETRRENARRETGACKF